MSKKIIGITFYSNFNNGDLHAVRSLIRYVTKTFHGYDYKLRHPNDEKVLKDLNIPLYWDNYIDLNNMKVKFDFRGYYQEYGILYFNTQVLCHDRQFFDNGGSFTISAFYNIFAKTLKDVFNHKMPNRILDFLPQINYDAYDIQYIKNLCMTDKNVLVCNNDPKSEQATKFDMNVLLEQVVDKFPDIAFYVTNKHTLDRPNVFYVNDITGDIGCDLNEISYLSTKCNVIMGKYSGPHTFCYVRENLLNPQKTFVTFSPPSPLYGSDPSKWCDFGTSAITTSGEHANFCNIPENNDEIRISRVCEILKNLG